MRYLKPSTLILLFLLSFNNILFSRNSDVFKIDSITREIVLDTLWKYQAGDDTLWSAYDYNDKGWVDSLQTTLDLSKIEDGIFNRNAWFRLHFKIDSSLKNKTFALNIDQQGASEIYLNGELIASHGTLGVNDQEEKTYNPKNIPFLIQFNDSLDYVLAIRYSNLKADRNKRVFSQDIAGFSLSLNKYESAVASIAMIGKVRSIFTAVFTVFLSIAFLHLLLFLFYRKQRSNLYFFLFLICTSSIWLVTLYSFSFAYNPSITIKVLYYLQFLVSLLFPFLSIFIYSIFYKKFPKISWVIIFSIPVILLLGFFQPKWVSQLSAIITIFILFDVVRNIIRAIIKKIKGAWLIGAGFALFILFFLIVIVIGLAFGIQNIDSQNSVLAIVVLSIFIPGVISIPVSMSIYLARDFAGTNRNLEKQLENVKTLSAKSLEQEREKQRILENQKERLEVMVDERTKELEEEKNKTEELLLNTLPLKVVNELKENGTSEPESFEDVTVYFSDIVGFTNISSKLEPKKLIQELNEIFTAFDDIMSKNNCERIKTIGDAYLAVSGMPKKNKNHAENMANAAVEIKHYLDKRNQSSEIDWQTRIGIHTGRVVGGIVGVRKYIYDVFGDTINTASRMESNSEPMRINVSETTYNILKERYEFIEREPISVKGKGNMKMFFLEA